MEFGQNIMANNILMKFGEDAVKTGLLREQRFVTDRQKSTSNDNIVGDTVHLPILN